MLLQMGIHNMLHNEEFKFKVTKDANPFIKASCLRKYHAR